MAQYPQIFKPFFRYLNTVPPPRPKNINDWHRMALAVTAFDGILAVISAEPSALSTEDSYIMQNFTSSWPGIWRWMRCLHSQAKSGLKGNHDALPQAVFTVTVDPLIIILRITSHFFLYPSTSACKFMEATPGLFLLLADIWIRLTENGRDDDDVAHHCALGMRAILGLIVQDTTRMKLLVDVLHGDLEKVASLLLKNVHAVRKERKKWTSSFPLLATTAITPLIPGLGHALLSQNAMVDISLEFAHFSSMSGPRLPDHDRCLLSCLQFFNLASITTDGFTWIIQAVRSGLIQAILRSAQCSRTIEDLSIKALVTVQRYLVYRSVLRVVDRALQEPDMPLLETQLSPDGKISKYWAYFKSFVQNRLEVKAAFDEVGKYTQTCFAPEVRNQLPKPIIFILISSKV